ncbi:MAG: hypothetical protein HYV05_02145 [Deltaproteobacteria bacterium]|nr:hypothetical protein [Deltaproteobacteria bacterium]
MHLKNRVSIVIVVGLLAFGSVWIQGDSATTSVSSSVPAPAPGQKKVVLKDLGMT